jgi:tRNA(Ile2) C34 agmatinyltransferase TiaS
MTDKRPATGTDWICAKCGGPLEMTKIRVRYLGSVFTMELPQCRSCGTVMVTEEIATGKMAEAEQVLEDK